MTKTQPSLRAGDWVEDKEAGVVGELIGSGERPGECRIRLPSGLVVCCLETNLARVDVGLRRFLRERSSRW